MKHVHAELMIAWANDTSIEIETRPSGEYPWSVSDRPRWFPDHQYRIKPAFPETTMTHEQLEHAWSYGPTRWSLKLTVFANAVLAHAVETGQLVVPDGAGAQP